MTFDYLLLVQQVSAVVSNFFALLLFFFVFGLILTTVPVVQGQRLLPGEELLDASWPLAKQNFCDFICFLLFFFALHSMISMLSLNGRI